METSRSDWLQQTCDWLRISSPAAPHEHAVIVAQLKQAQPPELEMLLDILVANFDQLSSHPYKLRTLMQGIASRVLDVLSATDGGEAFAIAPDTLAQAYDRLGEVDAQAAAHALQLLALQAAVDEVDDESIYTLAAILNESPPEDWQLAALGLSPLWNAGADNLELFFDRVHQGSFHPATMAVLLDLANYAFRKQRLDQHPWTEQATALTDLLASVVIRLEKLERKPSQFGQSVEQVQQVLSDSVALTISICDALGLIGNAASGEALRTAMALGHRRVQTEAAAALARLGDAVGQQRIIELAADPVARQRAVAYAEELDFAEAIDEAYRVPQALAESELAAWLAGPDQFGFPPAAIEAIDARTQYWPSYQEPRDCFLFRFTYDVPSAQETRLQVSNIGIVGPVTHAFQADLANLPIDDIYAAFAGWQAEHEEIFEVPADALNPAQRREAERLEAHFENLGFEVTEIVALTFFLGEVALLARLKQDGKQLCGVTDGSESLRFPVSQHPASLTPEVVLAIYRGRKLLRAFNP